MLIGIHIFARNTLEIEGLLLFKRVKRFSSCRDFVRFTQDQSLWNHFRNHRGCSIFRYVGNSYQCKNKSKSGAITFADSLSAIRSFMPFVSSLFVSFDSRRGKLRDIATRFIKSRFLSFVMGWVIEWVMGGDGGDGLFCDGLGE